MRTLALLLLCASFCATACVVDDRPPAALSRADAAAPLEDVRPARDLPDVTPVDPCSPGPCGPLERCGAPRDDGSVGSGNGVDDNCDGLVDEGCPCRPAEMRTCFAGPPDRRAVGACTDGVMRCTELGAWVGNECQGSTLPRAETCDGRDEDCDGAIDEDLADCANALRCPASAGVAPLRVYTLDGRTIDPDASGFRWTVECPAGVDPCPAPAAPADPVLRVMPVRAGRYVVTATVERENGRTDTCRFPLYVQGAGLRVELDWDRKGGVGAPGVDMDLHVAPIDRTTSASYRWFAPREDCYFLTCKAAGGMVQWSTSATDTRFAPSATSEACANAPPPFGDLWRASGRCWNPRLDTDNIACDPTLRDPTDPRFCFTENMVVDVPPDNVTFRLMVNFYADHGVCADADTRNDVVRPVLSVSCGGLVRAAIGSVDDGLVSMRCQDNPGVGSANWSWLAADVRFYTNRCGVRDCQVTPLRTQAGLVRCADARAADEMCRDEGGRLFIRHAGARPVTSEFPESP